MSAPLNIFIVSDATGVTASTEQLGKSAGKDQVAGKATFVALEGLEKARRRTKRAGNRGTRLLADVLPAGPAAQRLLDLSGALWQRGN